MVAAMTEKPGTSGTGEALFGFRRIGSEEHARRVRGVFASVAPRYDLMNDLMSGGLHRLWKALMIDWLDPRAGWTVVDIAGGTGDVAHGILRRVEARVVVCDPSLEMLNVGIDRAVDSGRLSGIRFVGGRAESLPFSSAAVDACTVAFGLRNVTDRAAALAEARRVLKPGGRMLCLEFSRPAAAALRPLYDAYSYRVLPRLGAAVAGDADAYRYLADSIRTFPDQETLADEFRAAGFGAVRYRNLSAGIAALHSAWRT